MRSSRCLRLARQSVVSQHSSGLPLRRPAATCVITTGVHQGAPTGCLSRALATATSGTPPKKSRFTTSPGEEGDDHASPYKQHRQEVLRQDQESEEPLYAELYPRLESTEGRNTVPEFLQKFTKGVPNKEVVLVMGRVRSKRVAGKGLVFLDIVNEFQKVQVMVNKRKCMNARHLNNPKFALFRNLVQVGDHISVHGVATLTESGEPTLEAQRLPELLAPSMEPIPEKLTDARTRAHERHVDMLVNKEAVDVLRLRAEITRHMREHFHSKRFLEFQTPILAENAGGAVARPFVTQSSAVGERSLALRVAPELWLKRLVVGGVDRVFEIGPAFRNEGIDATHNPEFTMCEFYSAYSNLADLMAETEELLDGLARRCQELVAGPLSSLPPVDLARFARPFRQVEFVPALEQALGVRLPNLSADGALPELLAVLRLAGVALPGEVPASLPRLLDRLAAVYLEPLSARAPVFITHHPACMSPLAKGFLCPATYQLVSARAELFVGGRELANMYEEENDPDRQRRKLLAHRSLVNRPDGGIGVDEAAAAEGPPDQDADDWAESPLDLTYVKALDYALPPTGGWGCGVERLVMLFSGARRIGDCLSFGTLRSVAGMSAAGGRAEDDGDKPSSSEADA